MDTQKQINILTKNSKGDPSRYEMVIDVRLKIINDQDKNFNKSFQERFNYKSDTNKLLNWHFTRTPFSIFCFFLILRNILWVPLFPSIAKTLLSLMTTP